MWIRNLICNDIVLDFIVLRNLYELDATLAPVAQRLDPIARAQVKIRLDVLVMSRIAIALHQAEAAGMLVHEPIDAQRVRIHQRTPGPLPRSGLGLQSVA